jgi:nucleoside phosphorylase
MISPNLVGRTIAYFYALDQDWQSFAEKMSVPVENITRGGYTFFRLRLSGTVVCGMKMGSGPVQTALSTQALLSLTPVDMVISSGPVGSMLLTFPVGQKLRVTNVSPWQSFDSTDSLGGQDAKILSITGPNLGSGFLINAYPEITVASGELFIASSELRERIQRSTNAHAVDMNLFGLAMALNHYSIPSIHLRVVSDFADENASEAFAAFIKLYKGDLGIELATLVKALPLDATNPDIYPELKVLFDSEKP